MYRPPQFLVELSWMKFFSIVCFLSIVLRLAWWFDFNDKDKDMPVKSESNEKQATWTICSLTYDHGTEMIFLFFFFLFLFVVVFRSLNQWIKRQKEWITLKMKVSQASLCFVGTCKRKFKSEVIFIIIIIIIIVLHFRCPDRKNNTVYACVFDRSSSFDWTFQRV